MPATQEPQQQQPMEAVALENATVTEQPAPEPEMSTTSLRGGFVEECSCCCFSEECACC
ncbi:hypothetical protein MCOR27_001531 [Pyricularia oryzae]|uniref:Uncharacterized protein n=5 Tax=Pyricularia TaxID=48558 RepID=A0ABQ8NG82_PYRGI|nr:uncharacterized protein MGG_11255 [Pyricularia oryzae 70-15]ELQ42438.1 hypothetical protein OOU_Y34scaffold00207g3 [Pyricularia oryzae Y34]KAH8836952.1 hypothetical protein MCOR01_010598 [Pyricularia oryzae]KAI6296581.1 hypothetical protein MCOR33_006852 [Pyricularia grisea]TLD26467.1 hypothetical protein PspLS_04442 [Pyricularia sp. CBS 133598]EHA54340.1 hypothetical protein MGG_11255 [Pyricularia oryzae 70-15]